MFAKLRVLGLQSLDLLLELLLGPRYRCLLVRLGLGGRAHRLFLLLVSMVSQPILPSKPSASGDIRPWVPGVADAATDHSGWSGAIASCHDDIGKANSCASWLLALGDVAMRFDCHCNEEVVVISTDPRLLPPRQILDGF